MESRWGPALGHTYNVSRVFSGGNAVRAWRWPPTPSSGEVKEREELYIYCPSGPSWSVLGWTLLLPLSFRYVCCHNQWWQTYRAWPCHQVYKAHNKHNKSFVILKPCIWFLYLWNWGELQRKQIKEDVRYTVVQRTSNTYCWAVRD